MSKIDEVQQELQHIAQLRAVEIAAIYQKYAEMTAPFFYQLTKGIFDEFPDLVSVSLEMAPQYDDESYNYGFGGWRFTTKEDSEHEDSDDDWESWHEEVSEYLSDALGRKHDLKQLLRATLGNADVKITREGIEVRNLGDDSKWTEEYY